MATILIVDDLAANRSVLVILLSAQGHRVIEAINGSDALAVIDRERPDLVITDVLMPVMDGYEFVRLLRLEPTTRDIAVMFYTAHYGEREARALALSMGVVDVVTKPIESAEVLRIVGRALTGDAGEARSTMPGGGQAQARQEHLRLLTNKLSEKAADLRVANARLRALINIALDFSADRNRERRLASLCASLRDLFGATYVTAGMVDRRTARHQELATCGTGDTQWIQPGETPAGIISSAMEWRRAIRGETAPDDPPTRQWPSTHPLVRHYLVAPVAAPSSVHGWICLVNNDGRAFDEDDEDLVMALSGQIGRVCELEAEISERQRAETSLSREHDRAERITGELGLSEERTRFALESANVGIWDMDYTTGTLEWSSRLEAQYGLAAGTFTGTFPAFLALVHPLDRAHVTEVLEAANRSGVDFTVQHRALRADGTIRWLTGCGRIHLDGYGKPLRGVGVSLDVTEHHALEEHYRHVQKMEGMGRLAGGVAHDFNNLLTVILGYTEFALLDLPPDDARQRDLIEIKKATQSAVALTKQLLAFSRKEMAEPTNLDLNVVVTSVRQMLRRMIGEDVIVVLDLVAGDAPVFADQGQLEQVVMNLAINARDAMPRGGTLTIATTRVELDTEYSRCHGDIKAGPYISLSVTDTGVGMSADVQARLFEPFFTTKERERGTGLGLATVHGIVSGRGGSVTVESVLGHGTTFRVYLPMTARRTGLLP